MAEETSTRFQFDACDVQRNPLDAAATDSLFRIALEGVQSMLRPWQGQSPQPRGHAWGCVSLSDVLLMLDVKYDAVTHMLYAEMLREHHGEWSGTRTRVFLSPMKWIGAG